MYNKYDTFEEIAIGDIIAYDTPYKVYGDVLEKCPDTMQITLICSSSDKRYQITDWKSINVLERFDDYIQAS